MGKDMSLPPCLPGKGNLGISIWLPYIYCM